MTSTFVRTLLEKRGLSQDREVEAFLNPSYVEGTHDPFLLKGMDKAVERVLSAIEKGEHIAIYTDFDCDGIPAGVVLSDFFEKIGYQDVEVYIPHRHQEGYGFHKEAIDTLSNNGTSLIITLDVGITAVEQVEHAKKLGIDVIITDHHELGEKLPDALAVVNPKREGYPFSDLCGAAVGFKLVQALLAEGRKRKIESFTSIQEGWEKWLLDMVGIATVADMVPLVDENRVLAYWGLKVLRKSPRPGIHALARRLRFEQRSVTEDEIGFLIAPRVNAASRMDNADIAFKLLSTKDAKEAEECAKELEALNRKRKGVVASIVKEARRRVEERGLSDSKAIVLGDPKWQPSLLGLVSNSLLEGRKGAVCVWGRDGSGALKGSCRSDGSVSVVKLFQESAGSIGEYGGHECAGGFGVSHEQVHALPEVFAEAAGKIFTDKNEEEQSHDLEVPAGKISYDFWKELSSLSPFGVGNPKPVLRLSSAEIADVKLFGKENNHTEVSLWDDAGVRIRAFQFFVTPDTFTSPPSPGSKRAVLAHLERDAFRGPESVALRIVDIV